MTEPNKNKDTPPPNVTILTQYTRDLSFENPHAPRSFNTQTSPPRINLNINVNARHLYTTDYEVSLLAEGNVGEGSDLLFKFELKYAGVFRLDNIPEAQIQPLLMIEGPRMLFPFARQIIADAVRNGGYPALYIDPVDFHGLYLQRLSTLQGDPAGHA